MLLPRHAGQEITDLPQQVENQDLIAARGRWAKEHPEDIILSEELDDTSLELHHLQTDVKSLETDISNEEDSLKQMSDDLPLKVSDDASTQLSPRISPDDSVISIQQRIENLQAEEDRKIDSESEGAV